MKIRNLLAGLVCTVVLTALPAWAQAPLPQWTEGNWYDMNEVYRVVTPLIGTDGFIQVAAHTHYDVVGKEMVTQEKGTVSTECWRLDFDSSSFWGTGQVNISDPLPLNGAARFLSGSISGTYFISTTDMSVVKRVRIIEGDAEVEMGPTWFPVGPLTITIKEEYDPSLQDLKFPLAEGDTWAQTGMTVYVFGDYSHQLIGSSPFESELTWNLNAGAVTRVSVEGPAGPCNTYHVPIMSDSTTEVHTWYCTDAAWFLKQEIDNIPLGDDGGFISFIKLYNEDYYVEPTGDTPTPVPTNTPTPGGDTPTPTPTPTTPGDTPTPTPTTQPGGAGAEVMLNGTTFTMGDTMNVDMRVYNGGASMYVHVYLVLELAGGYYFYPTFGMDPVSLYDGDLPTVDTGWFNLLQVPFTDPIGATVPLTWYAALLDVNYNLVGNLSTAAATLQ